MNISYWLEIVGYLASFIVLVSLLMSSIIKLRWINLLGSFIFSIYGFLIGAFPVALMNLCICIINIYYLTKIYGTKEYFHILPIESKSPYYEYFLEFYEKEICKYTSATNLATLNASVSFYILRNMVPAGIFIAQPQDKNTLKVILDFVIPEYRDFKIGAFIYERNKDYFLDKGYSKLISFTFNSEHIKYFKKMGFKEVIDKEHTYFIKVIGSS
jgi:hypothetical protein